MWGERLSTPELNDSEEAIAIIQNANVFIMRETGEVDVQCQLSKQYSMKDIKQHAEKHEIIQEFNIFLMGKKKVMSFSNLHKKNLLKE